MKKILLIIIILLMPIIVNASNVTDETKNIIDSQIKTSGASELQAQLEKVNNNDFSEILPDFNITNMAKSLTQGGWKWDIGIIFKRAFAFFCKQLFISINIMIQLIMLALLGALIENLQRSFGKDGASEVAFYACYCMVAGVGIKVFMLAVAGGQQVIDDMIVFMNVLIPSTLTLLATSGGVVSAGIFHPVIMMSIQVISLSVKNIIIPLIMLSTALKIADNLSSELGVGRLANLLNTAVKWLIGIILTVFIGIISVQSIAAPAIDGISIKTTKFAVSSFVPVVGSILADSVDLVLGCSVILKNAVGIAGLIGIVLICFAPAIRLFVQVILFQLTSALIEPISDKRIVNLIGELGNSLNLIFSMVITVTLMFIINITIIISAGNTAALMGR